MMKVKFKAMDKETRKWLYFDLDKNMSKISRIDHGTACICTGLKDDSGNDIYEGDILVYIDDTDQKDIYVGMIRYNVLTDADWSECGYGFVFDHHCGRGPIGKAIFENSNFGGTFIDAKVTINERDNKELASNLKQDAIMISIDDVDKYAFLDPIKEQIKSLYNSI